MEVNIEKRRLTMEVDCGSAESVIPEELFARNFRHLELRKCNKRLVVIDGNKLTVLGKVLVEVQLNGMQKQLDLVVLRCQNDFIPLMGRSWLDNFFVGWRYTITSMTLPVANIGSLDTDNLVDEIKHFAWRQNRFGTQTPTKIAAIATFSPKEDVSCP